MKEKTRTDGRTVRLHKSKKLKKKKKKKISSYVVFAFQMPAYFYLSYINKKNYYAFH